MAVVAPPPTTQSETLLAHAARSLSGVLGQRIPFHALSVLTGLAAIPVIDQVKLNGAWVNALGRGIQNEASVKWGVNILAGCAVACLSQNRLATLKAPADAEAKHKENEKSLTEVTNAMVGVERNHKAGDRSQFAPYVRFHDIMVAYDTEIARIKNVPLQSVTRQEHTPPSFSDPFKPNTTVAKPNETLVQHLGRTFSTLSVESGLACSILGACGTFFCNKILPKMNLTGTWTQAVSEKVHAWKVLKLGAAVGTGYVATVALKGVLNCFKSQNADKARWAALVKTLAQLSYAMHIVEIRGKDATTPCSKASLLERFQTIMKVYSEAVQPKIHPPQPAVHSTPYSSHAADPNAPFTDPEFNQFCLALQSAATPQAKQALINQLPSGKKAHYWQMVAAIQTEEIAKLTAATAASSSTGSA